MAKMPDCVHISMLGGNCPVQAEGFVADAPFYFRARGKHWTMEIGSNWQRQVKYSDIEFAAGWMDDDEARAIIAQCAVDYLEGKDP